MDGGTLPAPEPGLVAAEMREEVRLCLLALAVVRLNRMSLADLLGKDRAARLVRPRQLFMLRAAEAGFSTMRIGRFLGRDHTTVMHGIRAARARLEIGGAENGD